MYDYIVVGGGSAGCTIASRLSEDPANKVLLLEAGPKDTNPMIHMPGGCAEVLKSNSLNWQLWSTPQKNLNNRKLFVPRGRTLGGSSSANGMVYIRGHASDYNDWAAAGNKGWSYKEVLPYFKKSQDQARGADDYHGAGGELHVQDAPSDNPLFDLFIEAGKEIGIPQNDDFNGAEQEGIGRFQCTIRNGKRQSSAVAFLRPAAKRANLTVITGANVEKLELKGERAIGVHYRRGRASHRVKARKEIILSAGTIKNPQILQLSGIGHPDDLNRVGIATLHELTGVGRNLQEHLDLIIHYECTQPITLNGAARIDKQLMIGLNYMFFKKGVGAHNNIEGGAFLRSSSDEKRPDIQMHFCPAYMLDLTSPLPKQHGVTLHACNLRPKAQGTVTLASGDPSDQPLIDFNFLDNEQDWQKMISAFKISRELMHAAAWNGYLGKQLGPAANASSDEEIRAAIKEIADTIYHPVGTCKMGTDSSAVVGADLKVHGIDGLRVADASIIPSLIGGNTNAPAIMIGEKCADLILGRTLPPANIA